MKYLRLAVVGIIIMGLVGCGVAQTKQENGTAARKTAEETADGTAA